MDGFKPVQPGNSNQNPQLPTRRMFIYDRPHAGSQSAMPSPVTQPQQPPVQAVQSSTSPPQPVTAAQPSIAPKAPIQEQERMPLRQSELQPAPQPKPDLTSLKPVWDIAPISVPKELQLEHRPLNIAHSQPPKKSLFEKHALQPIGPGTQPLSERPGQVPMPDTPVPQLPLPQSLPEDLPPVSRATAPAPIQIQELPYEPPAQEQPPKYDAPVARPPRLAEQTAPLDQQFAEHAQNAPKKRRLAPVIPKLITGMAVIVFLAGGVTAFNTYRTNKAVKQEVATQAPKSENDVLGLVDAAPSEVPPAANVTAYNPAPDEPRGIAIPAIDLEANVVRVGASSVNIVKAPTNIYDVGWYQGSAKPGQEGAVVLNGHVTGSTKGGALYNVDELKIGDEITITTGNKKTINYKVQNIETFENDDMDMSKMLTPAIYGKKGLNIMTVGGRFNTDTNSYELRYAIYATQVE